MEQLWQLGGHELIKLIRDRAVSAREVVGAHLARIETVNHRVNAITVVMAEQALAAAGEADRKAARGEPLGTLHGLPITIKENIDVAGTATTWGVPAFAEACHR